MNQREMEQHINTLLQWKASFDEDDKPKKARPKKEDKPEAATTTTTTTAANPLSSFGRPG